MTKILSAEFPPPPLFQGFPPGDVESSIPARFERMVRSFPDHPAVSASQCYSYDELNRQANRIARAVLASAEADQQPVALLLEHDAPIIAATLGVLKAGKTYVALNPALPAARLRSLLDDLPAYLLLTDAAHQELAAALARPTEQVLSLEALGDHYSEENLELAICPTTPAAIFYTSGSTGEPKGVVRTHRTILHRIRVDTNSDLLTAQDRFSLLFLCSYGTSFSDLFDALLNGATLAMFDPQTRSLPELTAWLQAEQITSLHIPIALLRQWLETLEANTSFPALRRLRPAGQLLRRDLAKLWPHLPPDARIFSQFASSETVLITRATFTRDTALETEVLHVGKPIPETEVLLLDDGGKPVRLGDAGRIHVRSRYLSSGYWRRPDLTADVFLPDPQDNGFQLCRTGDWGRWRADGNLELLGRQDAVVKIRGHRVELNDVQITLQRLDCVRDVVVIAQDHEVDGKRLVAYVVPAPSTGLTVSDLRGALAQTLPEQAIPATFVFLDQLPLLPNGKLDLQGLPAAKRARPLLAAEYRAPSTAQERVLATIWCEVLELDDIGVDDHFLELGGNSLRAMRICVRASRAFQLEVAPRLLFELPTIAALAAVLADLQTGARPSFALVAPSAAATPVPLSFAQQRLWLVDRLLPGTAIYNVARAYCFSGALKMEALRQSLDFIIARHATLRTTFAGSGDAAQQIIHPARTVDLPLVDLSHLPAPEAAAEAARLAEVESQQPFDLTRDLLLRARLLRLSAQEHWLVVTKHHIASDGWSANILWREMAACYEAFAAGHEPNLPPLPVDYAAYAVWQRERWASGEWQPQLAYWQRQLTSAPPLLELPTDRPRSVERTFQGAMLLVELPSALVAALNDWARQEQLTLYWVTLTAFKILLLRYTGQEDLLVGAPAAGRPHPDLEGVLGCFLNDLVLRTQLSGELTVREALARVRATVLGAFANQDVPFETVLEAVHPERSRSRTPLFQVMFNLLTLPPFDKRFGPLAARRLVLDSRTTKLDLSVALRASAEAITGYVEYNRELFDEATIRRFFAHYVNVLSAMVADPTQHIGTLPLLDAAERQQLLVEWNETATAYPRTRCIHELFAEQAARTPEAVAVIAGEQQLTYGELEQKSQRLALHLRALGLGAKAVVGVLLERSPQMIVAWLAVLKAGGAYLPLDPQEPPVRLQQMLTDAEVPLVLTRQEWRKAVTQVKVLCLDEDGDEVRPSAACDDRDPLSSAESLAYVMYTSGSTGHPKGVAIPHRAVVRLVRDTDYVQLAESDCLAQVSHAAFDAATFEVWGALLNGARVVLLARDIVLAPKTFAAQLQQHGVTTLFLTTALFNLMAKAEPQAFRSLRTLLFGGEACDPQCVRAVLQQGRPQRLLHVYGPTESTTFATWHLVQNLSAEAATVPIGRPLANTMVYVLDAQLQPVPVGVTGELYIGGDGLAREYLGQPDWTAKHFVAMRQVEGDNGTELIPADNSADNSLASSDGLRLYKTGDLARWLADGSLEFMGRKDQQIKVRGFRVELGEVEAALLRHVAVHQAVVLARQQEHGMKLFAYIVPQARTTPTPKELGEWLRGQLPAYMLPTEIMLVAALPLTPNGKLDRAALSASSLIATFAPVVTAPHDALEWQLTQLWENALGVGSVGVTDNFFDLGGHSLAAVRLFEQIAKTTGQELPVSILLQAPTIAALATVLRQHDWQPAWQSLVAVQPRGSRPPLFLAPPAVTTVLRFEALLRYLDAEQPVYGLQYRGVEDDVPPHQDLKEMAAFFVEEIRHLQPHGPYFLGGVCFGSHLMFEIAQRFRAAGEEVALLAVLDAAPPEGGPAWECPHRDFFAPRRRFHYYLQETVKELQQRQLLYRLRTFLQGRWERFQVWRDPLEWRKLRTKEAHFRAQSLYVAEPYAGRLLILQSEEFEKREEYARRWQALALGEFEHVVISGSTHREALLQEPHVQQTATVLQQRLSAAAGERMERIRF